MNVNELTGLRLVRSTDADFTTLLQAFPEAMRNDVSVELLGPFSLVLRNETSQTIIGVAICYSWTEPSGYVTNHDQFAHSLDQPNGFHIAPGGLALITPKQIFAVPQGPGAPPQQPSEHVTKLNELKDKMANLAAITVSIDAVISEDGTFIGPNETKAYEIAIATVTERQVLAAEVLQRHQSGQPDAEIFAWLKEISEGNSGQEGVHRVRLMRWGPRMRQSYAMSLLVTYQAKGAEAAYEQARRKLAQQHVAIKR